MFYTDLSSMKIDDLTSLYEKDVIFIDPIDKHQGIDAVKEYFSRLLCNAKNCKFTIHSIDEILGKSAVIKWTMTYSTKRLNGGEPVEVDGITWLDFSDGKIVLHRDYFDLGQMVYENVPVLGFFVKKVKGALG
ncbi:MAG: nuclear transport factor 2 family protein [Pseudomonadota bacterium]